MLYQNTNSTEMRSSHLRLYDLLIPNLDAAGGEVGELEFDADRTFAFPPLGATHSSPKPTCHSAYMLVIPFDGR